MNSILDLLKDSKYNEKNTEKSSEKTAPSERHEIISEFTNRLNINRSRDGMKLLSCAIVNKQLKNLKNGDLYIFLANCKEVKNFDKFYWWSLKNTFKKVKTPV